MPQPKIDDEYTYDEDGKIMMRAHILKAEKFAESAFSVTKNLRKKCVNLDIKILRQKCVNR